MVDWSWCYPRVLCITRNLIKSLVWCTNLPSQFMLLPLKRLWHFSICHLKFLFSLLNLLLSLHFHSFFRKIHIIYFLWLNTSSYTLPSRCFRWKKCNKAHGPKQLIFFYLFTFPIMQGKTFFAPNSRYKNNLKTTNLLYSYGVIATKQN